MLKTLRLGLILAFIPSIFTAELRIAIASVCAFCCSQVLDVYVFFYLKQKFPKIWYLRNNGATLLSQLVDTMIFFHIAFLFIQPHGDVILMALSDYTIKILLCVCNTPLFWSFAIRGKTLYKATFNKKDSL